MLSDEEDNTLKISVPIITNEELERLDYTIENDLNNIVRQISETVSRDRDIIILKKVIEKQQKEIEELNKSDASKEQSSMNYYNLYKELVDKIKAKIEEYKEMEKATYGDLTVYGDYRRDVIQEVLREFQSLLEKE